MKHPLLRTKTLQPVLSFSNLPLQLLQTRLFIHLLLIKRTNLLCDTRYYQSQHRLQKKNGLRRKPTGTKRNPGTITRSPSTDAL